MWNSGYRRLTVCTKNLTANIILNGENEVSHYQERSMDVSSFSTLLFNIILEVRTYVIKQRNKHILFRKEQIKLVFFHK